MQHAAPAEPHRSILALPTSISHDQNNLETLTPKSPKSPPPRRQVDTRNSSGATALYNAASQGHVGLVRELVAGGAAPDAPTTNGCTPLYIAANNGWADAADALAVAITHAQHRRARELAARVAR